jgi:hypothetical protein
MKSFQQMILTASFAALACTGMEAQSTDMRATIPFDFHAGNKLMPAGQYIVHGEGPLLWLRAGDNGNPTLVLMTIPSEGPGQSRGSRLDFQRYGSEYFLTAVWNSFTQSGREAPKTAREKELAKRDKVPVPIVITLASSK